MKEEIQELRTYVSHVIDAYNYMHDKVDRLQKEVEQLKGIEPKKPENTDNTVLINTKYPHMKIILPQSAEVNATDIKE